MDAVDNKYEDMEKDDDVEERVIKEMHCLGRRTLGSWGKIQAERKAQKFFLSGEGRKDSKKLSWYATYGMIKVEEQQFLLNDKKGSRFRPFSFSANLSCGAYSLPLTRRICDFGADHSFAESAKKLKEHYGIDIPLDMIRKITECHASGIKEQERKGVFQNEVSAQAIVVGETDGRWRQSAVLILKQKWPSLSCESCRNDKLGHNSLKISEPISLK